MANDLLCIITYYISALTGTDNINSMKKLQFAVDMKYLDESLIPSTGEDKLSIANYFCDTKDGWNGIHAG